MTKVVESIGIEPMTHTGYLIYSQATAIRLTLQIGAGRGNRTPDICLESSSLATRNDTRKIGGPDRIQTCDMRDAITPLYQLSYEPERVWR